MKKDVQEILIHALLPLLKEIGAEELSASDIQLDLPADVQFGDLSTNIAMRLASRLKKPPFQIATKLVELLRAHSSKNGLDECIENIKVEGAGFINFYLSKVYLHNFLQGILTEGSEYLRVNLGKGEHVLVEFVSANPTGPLSVAHARQAAVGDVLANIFNFLGYNAKREYYLNDEGNQINILGNSVFLRYQELIGKAVEFPEDHYQGEYIYDIAQKVRDLEHKTSAEEIKKLNFPEYAADHILAIIKEELIDFGVKFDYWTSQKALHTSGKIEKVLSLLKKNDFIYEQDGAEWFASTRFGDDKDRVVIKSDGSYTYLAPDIAYHQDKLHRKFKRLINLLGPDHHGYINRLKAAVAALGEDPQCLSVVIVQLASISREGKPVQMSTRRGQYITLREVLDEVGMDAARFFFLMRRTSSHLDFDLAIAKKQTSENPVYYVQYAYARIASILRNVSGEYKVASADLDLLKEKEELLLMKKIWQLRFILEACVKTIDPYLITVYLQELAESFHKFYDLHRVLTDNPELTSSRLSLIKAAQITLGAGFEILGVSRPDKM